MSVRLHHAPRIVANAVVGSAGECCDRCLGLALHRCNAGAENRVLGTLMTT